MGRAALDTVADMAGFVRPVAETAEKADTEVIKENTAWAADPAQDPAAAAAPAPGAQAAPAAAPASGGLEKEALLRKQEELNRQEQDIKALQQDVDAKLMRLQELEAKLGRMLEEAKDTKDAKLKHLVDVYSNMKAQQAATVLESLDERIAVKILAGMRGRQAGEILTFVGAEKAARLSEALTRMQVPFQ